MKLENEIKYLGAKIEVLEEKILGIQQLILYTRKQHQHLQKKLIKDQLLDALHKMDNVMDEDKESLISQIHKLDKDILKNDRQHREAVGPVVINSIQSIIK